MIKKAVIPAAGLGTRFLPATKAQPKEMLPIVDTPAIQYVVEEAINSGLKDILIIIGRGERAVVDHFDRNFELESYLKRRGQEKLLQQIRYVSNLAHIYFVRQKEPAGLGDAISYAEEHVGRQPFALLLGDAIIHSPQPCIGQLISIFEKYQKTVMGVEEVPSSQVSKYGIIKGRRINHRLFEVEDLVEKPSLEETPSRLAIGGRYVLVPEIFALIRKTSPDQRGEVQLTDALRLLDEKLAYLFPGRRYDIGDKLGYLKAQVEFGLERKEFSQELREFLKEIIEP